jgi:hypothetical protein
MKKFSLSDILTDPEIETCLRMYRDNRSTFHERCLNEIVRPNMERINKALGQENDARYITYAIEYVIGQAGL